MAEKQPRRFAISELAAGNGNGNGAPAGMVEGAPQPPRFPDLGGAASDDVVREVVGNLARHWRIGLLMGVLVAALGMMWWSNQKTSAVATATILKKNLMQSWFPQMPTDEWQRTWEADIALMKSETVSHIAKRLIIAVSRLSTTDRRRFAPGQLAPAQTRPVSPLAVSESGTRDYIKRWLVIDTVTGRPLEPEWAQDRNADTLILDQERAEILVKAYEALSDPQEILALAESNVNLAGLFNAGGDAPSGEITVSVTHAKREVAAFLANVMLLAFIATHDRQVVIKNRQDLAIFLDMLEKAKAQLTSAKEESAQRQREMDRRLEEVGKNRTFRGNGYNLQQLRNLLSQVEWEFRLAEAKLSNMEEELHNSELDRAAISDPVKKQLLSMEEELNRLLATERAESPKIIEMQRRIDNLRRVYEERGDQYRALTDTYEQFLILQVFRAKQSALAEHKSHILLLKQQREDLLAQIAEYPKLANDIEQQAVAVESSQQRLDAVTKALEEARFKTEKLPEYYKWKLSATPEGASLTSKTSLLIGVIFGSILLGLVTSQLVGKLNTRVTSEAQAKQLTMLPSLVNLPVLSRHNRYISRDTTEGRRTNSLIYNLFGILAVNLRHCAQGRPEKLLAVTSTMPGEGKSFVAFNLAAYYASQGLNTCLVQCDYRHPNLEMFPDFDSEQVPGFIEYLAQNGDVTAIEQCFYPTDIPNLTACVPGRITAPPMNLLDTPAFTEFLESLKQRFDAVIIDCAPALLVVDTSIIARQAVATLLVVGMNTVKKGTLQACIERLAMQGINVLGMVMNRDRIAAQGYYYRYYGEIIPQVPPRRQPTAATQAAVGLANPLASSIGDAAGKGASQRPELQALLNAAIETGAHALPTPGAPASESRIMGAMPKVELPAASAGPAGPKVNPADMAESPSNATSRREAVAPSRFETYVPSQQPPSGVGQIYVDAGGAPADPPKPKPTMFPDNFDDTGKNRKRGG